MTLDSISRQSPFYYVQWQVIRYEVYLPQPLPWRTIISRCWSGGLKLNSIEVSDPRGVMLKF
jgi:hypothetical protein